MTQQPLPPPPSQSIGQRGMDNRPAWMTQQPLPPPPRTPSDSPSPPYNPNADSLLKPDSLNDPENNEETIKDKEENKDVKKTISIE